MEEGRVEDEGWRVRKDGTRFWADVVITAIHDEAGTLHGFAKITRDLTERRRQEESLEQRVDERTRDVNKANEQLMSMVDELEHFHDIVVGRELRMIELEREIAALKQRLSACRCKPA